MRGGFNINNLKPSTQPRWLGSDSNQAFELILVPGNEWLVLHWYQFKGVSSKVYMGQLGLVW